MPIDIREDLTARDVTITEGAVTTELNLSLENALTVVNEGLHAIATRNFTRYSPDSLKKSVPSWTAPYMKPVIMHHNEYDGKTIGRIKSAEYVTKGTRSGTPALRFTLSIGDWEGQSQIRDGRLLTTSVGITATDVRCSICNQNIAEERCEHDRGAIYDGETCYWDVHEFEGKELSYVITPSDPYAANVQIIEPGKSTPEKQITSSLNEGVNKANPQNQKNTIVEQKMEDKNNTNQIQTNQDGVVINESAIEGNSTTEPVVAEDQNNAPPVDGGTPEGDQGANKEPETQPDTTVKESNAPEPPNSEPQVQNQQIDLAEQVKLVAQLQEQLKIEKQLREQLEATYSDILVKYKKSLAEKLNGLRKSAGKTEIQESELLGRTVESLNDSIKDILGETIVESSNPNEQNPAQNTQTIIESNVAPPINIDPPDAKTNKPKAKEQKAPKGPAGLEEVLDTLFKN